MGQSQPRRRRTRPSVEDRAALQEKWERILVAEGLPAEPKRPFMRDSKQDAEGVRRWRGPREISSDLIDVLGYDERVLTATEKLMQAPHAPLGGYTAEKLHELREALLDAIEDTLTAREAEALVSIVLGQDTYESVSRRMKLPRSTCYLTVARGLDKLRNVLEDVPEVAEYLERHAVKETE